MPYISLTPTLRYRMLTVTNCLVLPTIACRMHFAEQHATLDNVYETDYAEIVSDTPFDTVMQELSELLQRLFPENEFRSYAKCYLEILPPSEEMDYATLMSILKVLFGVSVASGNDGLRNNSIYSGHLTLLRAPLVGNRRFGTDRAMGHPHSSSSREAPCYSRNGSVSPTS